MHIVHFHQALLDLFYRFSIAYARRAVGDLPCDINWQAVAENHLFSL